MIRSLINYILPDDEEKRLRGVYFIAEASIILSMFLLLYIGLSSWFNWDGMGGLIVAVLCVFFIGGYSFITKMLVEKAGL